MSKWFRKISQDIIHLADCIVYYENELKDAALEAKLIGNLEQASASLPGIVEYRFNQLQEIEAILEHLNILYRKTRAKKYRHFLESYNKTLTSRDAEKFIDGESDVMDMAQLVNEFALIRNKYLGLFKALEAKGYQINNITKLVTAGMEDFTIK